MKDILLTGGKRSGHHAVLAWIATQLDETVRHYNDILFDEFMRGKIRPKSRPGDLYEGNERKLNLFSMEDVSIEDLRLAKKSPRCGDLTIIVLRDIRNILASNIKGSNPKTIKNHLAHISKVWAGFANAYLNDKQEYYILFDKWFKDVNYRQQICKDLNINFTDKGLNRVSNYGEGSSFDRMNFNGKAQKMDVLIRWVAYKDNPIYLKSYTPRLEELNTKIFGE